mmetsp:Transcript_68883/g.175016  ORF Transcript_68883/g.175016 Transcript_68883/m.175016 type:complete len:219 (+) Transcript_68883:813-1469(+)
MFLNGFEHQVIVVRPEEDAARFAGDLDGPTGERLGTHGLIVLVLGDPRALAEPAEMRATNLGQLHANAAWAHLLHGAVIEDAEAGALVAHPAALPDQFLQPRRELLHVTGSPLATAREAARACGLPVSVIFVVAIGITRRSTGLLLSRGRHGTCDLEGLNAIRFDLQAVPVLAVVDAVGGQRQARGENVQQSSKDQVRRRIGGLCSDTTKAQATTEIR